MILHPRRIEPLGRMQGVGNNVRRAPGPIGGARPRPRSLKDPAKEAASDLAEFKSRMQNDASQHAQPSAEVGTPDGTGSDGAPFEIPAAVAALLRAPTIEHPDGISPLRTLRTTEAFWNAMKRDAAGLGRSSQKKVVERVRGKRLGAGPPEFDVCVAGGTLGVLIALALQQRGWRVCIVERRRKLEGRTQVCGHIFFFFFFPCFFFQAFFVVTKK
jgi:hypothetical protein